MNLECAIISILTAAPRAISAPVILGMIDGYQVQEPTLADINLALKSLERQGHVKGTANKDRGTLWKETDDGRLRVS